MLVFLLTCGFVSVFANSQGHEKCVNYINGQAGRCRPEKECPSAIDDLRFDIRPQFCQNNASDIKKICCLEEEIQGRSEMLKILTTYDECLSLHPINRRPKESLTQGNKAWQMCLKYQNEALFPCGIRYTWREIEDFDNYDMVSDITRLDFCSYNHGVRNMPVGGGGADAKQNEFPHMVSTIFGNYSTVNPQWASVVINARAFSIWEEEAQQWDVYRLVLLGYGKNFSEAEFYCGGSLISERFVLTAGHCTYAIGLGNVSFAVLGVLTRERTPLDKYIYGVKTIIKHPMYKPPIKYHDIALLEMDRLVKFDAKVIPACLHVGDPVGDTRAYGTGWGAVGRGKNRATIMQNVPLWKVSDETCRFKFLSYKRHLPDGINNSTQMCYGDDGTPRDTCAGDSGGPLQIKSKDIYCMYLILGVTSFGYVTCAEVGYPGVYTRVSQYVPWIESVVWP